MFVQRRVEQPLQLADRLVELPLVRQANGPPVGNARLQRGPLVQHQVEQTVRVGQLVRRRVRLQQQRTGPFHAQVEVNQGEQLRVAGQLVELEFDVDIPELFACQPVVRVELQGAEGRKQGRPIAADRGVTDTPQHVLEDAQPRQYAERVPEVEDHRDQKPDRAAERLGPLGDQGQPEAERGAHCRDLDLRLLLLSGKCQQVEDGQTKQQKDAEDGLILDPVASRGALDESETVDGSPHQGRAHHQAQAQTDAALADVAQYPEQHPEGCTAPDHLQEQRIGFAVADQPGTQQRAAQDAAVDEGGTFQQQEQDEGGEAPADAVALSNLPQSRESQG